MPPSPDLDPAATQEQVTLGGRYVLGPVLGRGGMADVHRATDLLLDRSVAVKVLRDEVERARFVDEARTLASLAHPGLVTLLDAGLDGERPYLVMDLVTGGTLRDHCREPRIDRGWAASIGSQIADALAAVHAAGVVHRDIKPGNVLLDGDRTRLADFGIARLLSEPAGHTRTGAAVGTAAYLAPEQVTGASVTTSADVYALGLVLLELLSGERAYAGAPVEAAVARLHQPPAMPHDLSAGWQSLLREMTVIEPAARPTAAEAALRLRVIASAYAAAETQVQTAPFELSPLAAATGALATLRPAPAAGVDPADPSTRKDPASEVRRTSRLVTATRELAQSRPFVALGAAAAAAVAAVLLGVGLVGLVTSDDAAVATTVDEDAETGLPDGVPAELRAPLADLHEAVRG